MAGQKTHIPRIDLTTTEFARMVRKASAIKEESSKFAKSVAELPQLSHVTTEGKVMRELYYNRTISGNASTYAANLPTVRNIMEINRNNGPAVHIALEEMLSQFRSMGLIEYSGISLDAQIQLTDIGERVGSILTQKDAEQIRMKAVHKLAARNK